MVVPCIVKIWLYVSGAEEVVLGLRQLDTDQHRFEPADQHEEQRGDAVQDADLLVIDRRQPVDADHVFFLRACGA